MLKRLRRKWEDLVDFVIHPFTLSMLLVILCLIIFVMLGGVRGCLEGVVIYKTECPGEKLVK